MKRKMCMLCAIVWFLLSCLPGCGVAVDPSEEIQIYVNCKNQSSEELLSVGISYYAGEALIGSVSCCHADNTPIPPGEVNKLDIFHEALPEDMDLSQIKLELTVETESGKVYSASPYFVYKAEYGTGLEVAISGNESSGFTAEWVSEGN